MFIEETNKNDHCLEVMLQKIYCINYILNTGCGKTSSAVLKAY